MSFASPRGFLFRLIRRPRRDRPIDRSIERRSARFFFYCFKDPLLIRGPLIGESIRTREASRSASPPGAACDCARGKARYKVVVGKQLIGQITLIKGNNVGRFHGRITMRASQVHLNISLMPAGRRGPATADMRALFRTHQCPQARPSSVVRKGRSSKLFRNAIGLPREAVRRVGIKFVLPF